MAKSSIPRKLRRNQCDPRDGGRAAERGGAPPVALDVRFGKRRHTLTVADLEDEERIAAVADEICASNARVKFQLRDPLSWPDEARSVVTMVLAPAAGPRGEFCLNGSAETKYGDLFELMMSVEARVEETTKFARYMRALVEATAVCHPTSLTIACNRAANRLRDLGLRNLRTDELVRQAKALCDEDNAPVDAKGLAAAFLEVYRDEIGLSEQEAVCYTRGDFLLWEGKRWRKLADQDFEPRVTAFLQSQPGVDVKGQMINDVIVNLAGMVHLDVGDDGLPLWVESRSPTIVLPSRKIVLANGMLDEDEILAADLDDPDSDVILTNHDPRNLSLVCLPYGFAPSAECPLWEQSLAEIFVREGEVDRRIELLQEYMGWTLLCDPRGFEYFLVLSGKGANGKSTVINVWTELLGRANVSHIPLDELADDFRIVELEGKLANIAADMNHMSKVAEGRLKQIVSCEPISANRKHKEAITLRSRARLIFATNQLPFFADRSEGIWRRLIVIPFKQEFGKSKRDRSRAKRLIKTELPGIFLWALRGAQRLLKQDDFTECGVCVAAAAEHRRNSDSIAEFIDQCCTVAPGAIVSSQALYYAYSNWCNRHGRTRIGDTRFGMALKSEGIEKHRESVGGRRYFYRGITLTRMGENFAAHDREIFPHLTREDVFGLDGESEPDVGAKSASGSE